MFLCFVLANVIAGRIVLFAVIIRWRLIVGLLIFIILAAAIIIIRHLHAKQHVANLLAHREVSRLAVGERIRVDGIEGTIIEISSTTVEVTTKEGVASIPAARFAVSGVLRIRGETQDG